jgi:hypothetical protein
MSFEVNTEVARVRLRRQPRGQGLRFSCNVTAALDGETYEVLDRVSRARGLARGLIVTNMLREWARREREAEAGKAAIDPGDEKARSA